MMKLGKDCLLQVILQGPGSMFLVYQIHFVCTHFTTTPSHTLIGTFTTYPLAFVPKTSYCTKLECNWLCCYVHPVRPPSPGIEVHSLNMFFQHNATIMAATLLGK